MSQFTEALKRKYKTPEAAVAALGLDAALLEDARVQQKMAMDAKNKFSYRNLKFQK